MISTPPGVVTSSTVNMGDDAVSTVPLNRAFISCVDAAFHMHELLKDQRTTEFSGFVLKNIEGRFFCAQQKVNVVADDGSQDFPVFALTVSVDMNAAADVPSGYTLEAVLLVHGAKTKGWDESPSNWAQRRLFFAVADLFQVMSKRRQYARCYLSLADGALIAYTSKESAFEEELSRHITRKPDGQLQSFEKLYERGAIPSGILLLLAVAAGELTVVVPGSLWRRPGQLTASWREEVLQQNPPIERMPVCGSICQNEEEVARYLNSRMLNRSTAQQHVGMVLKHRAQDKFVVTEPVVSNYATFNREVLFPKDVHGNPVLPPTFRVHGFFHSTKPASVGASTTADGERYRNFFSPADLEVGLERLSIAPLQQLFFCSPDGAILRFAHANDAKAAELRRLLALETGGLPVGMSVRTYIDTVAEAGELTVLFASTTWPATGRVTGSVAHEDESAEPLPG